MREKVPAIIAHEPAMCGWLEAVSAQEENWPEGKAREKQTTQRAVFGAVDVGIAPVQNARVFA